jgi:hypothetical protein
MSVTGQKATSTGDWTTSALPPAADVVRPPKHVRYVPHADILQVMMARIKSTCIGLPGRVLSFTPILGHLGNAVEATF